MSEPRNDDERLSALLDGRVDERQRRELLAHLVTSDDDYEVFTHAAIVLRQLEEQERGAGPQVPVDEPQADADEPPVDEPQAHAAEPQVPVDEPRARADEPLHIVEPPAPVAGPAPAGARPVPPSTRAGGWRKRALWVAPLVVAALALAAVWVSRNRASADDPVRVAARLDASGRGLPTDWPGSKRWGPMRGNGAPAPTTPEEANARAVQAGAMLVDLAVVARAGNPIATRQLARHTVGRLEPGAGHGNPLVRIADRPGAPPDSLERLLAQATENLARLGRDPLRLGAWAEAATIAARRHDAAFFKDGEKRAMLRLAERLAARDRDARAAIVRAAAAEPPDWTELEAALKDLVDKLGN